MPEPPTTTTARAEELLDLLSDLANEVRMMREEMRACREDLQKLRPGAIEQLVRGLVQSALRR